MIFPCRGRGPRLRHAAIMEEASEHDILIDGNRDTLEMQWKEISFCFAVAAADGRGTQRTQLNGSLHFKASSRSRI